MAKRERKNSFENYAPKTHTEHKEYRGNKCRIKNGKFRQGREKGRAGGNFTIAARQSGWVGKETIN